MDFVFKNQVRNQARLCSDVQCVKLLSDEEYSSNFFAFGYQGNEISSLPLRVFRRPFDREEITNAVWRPTVE